MELLIGLIFFGIWFGLTYWGVKLAKSKGRSPLLGGLLGFFFGIFGIIFIALLPTNWDGIAVQRRGSSQLPWQR